VSSTTIDVPPFRLDLLDAVWGAVAVTEDVVRVSAGELRAALGDDRTAARFLSTVPRRGYRFVARLADSVRSRSRPRRSTARARERSTSHAAGGLLIVQHGSERRPR